MKGLGRLNEADISVFAEVKKFNANMEDIFTVWYGNATAKPSADVVATFSEVVGPTSKAVDLKAAWLEIAGSEIEHLLSWKDLQAIPTTRFAECKTKTELTEAVKASGVCK